MRFAFRCLLLLVCGLFVAPLPLSAQSAAPLPIATQAAPAPASSTTATASSGASQPGSPAQAYTLSPDKLARAIALTRIRNILDIAGSVWGIVFLWLLLSLRGWSRIEAWAQRRSPRRWMQGAWFFFAFFLLTWLAALPLDLIGHHFERSFQISVEGWASWFADEGKALALTLVVGTLVLLFFHWIVRKWPRRYWFGVWLVTLPLLVLSIFVEPLIEPLFFQFQPLSRNYPALVQELEKVVARTGTDIPPDRMFLMLASEKTNGLNAYVTGLGVTKRIVVWDNTAGRIPDDEILFIFAHETGHYVLNHIPKMIAGYAAGLFFVYWGCSAFAAWLIRRFGARWGALDPEHASGSKPAELALASRTGFVVLLFTVSIAAFLLEPAGNAFSRHFEHQADVYGQEAIHGIVPDPQKTAVAAFNDLGKAWLDDPDPNPLIEFWLSSHPSTQARANFALHYNPWANGGHGKYFIQ
ncbi:MAG TPA: M48 family metalloprotease [Terracidiphilus sp.]|nr:M48 family metalloprotease [Terracidiphilus sp.]